MNLALFTSIPAFRLPPPRLAPEQINFGPGMEDVVLGNWTLSLRTPRGNFDAVGMLRRLSLHQQPDALAVLVDSHGASWPRGLAGFPGPKVLLLADQPLGGEFAGRLAEYIRSEPFDRVIALSDRRAALGLRQAGCKNVAWLPGWLFPHSDAEVGLARASERLACIAVCGRIGPGEAPLLRLTSALTKQPLPVYPRMVPEAEVPAHFGAASLALVDNSGGGLDLRLFQALTVGTATLAGRPASDSGWESLWPEAPFATFDRPEQLLERIKHFAARPKEAQALGARASRWFAECFTAGARQRIFSALVLDNRVQPEFVLPLSAGPGGEVVRPAVAPEVESSVPADPAATQARELLESGNKPKALELAMATLKENAASWQSALVVAEIALDAGKPDLWTRMLAAARTHAPESEHLALLAIGSRAFLKEWRIASILVRAWTAWENREWQLATILANRALLWDSGTADSFLLAGKASYLHARQHNLWMQYGKILSIVQLATEANPRRPDLWHSLAVARRIAGTILPEAAAAYRQALQLDPERLEDWFGLGEVLLAVNDADGAAAALVEALRRAPHSSSVQDWLGHARKRQGRLLEAEVLHREGFGATAKSARPNLPRRRAVFVLQNGHGWPCWASVHEEFLRDPSWETVVVGLPWQHPSFANSSHKDQDKVFDFLAEKEIAHVRWTDFSLLENSADIVFLQNPYDSTRPEGWKVPALVAAGHRICYVPYAIEIGASDEALEYQFDMRLHRYAWAIFARSEPHRALFAQHCLSGHRHVAVTGHPKFDDIGRSDRVAPDPELLAFARGRPLVLWNPHFDARMNGTRYGDGFSTFLRWRDFLLEEFARRPELAFVIRPHPNFFSALEERGFLTAAEAKRFLAQCDAAGVFVHRSPAYFPMLAAADAMISDGSSLLIEFGITGKPVCYLHNPDGPMAHLTYELDFDFVRQHCHWATEEAEIRTFLDGLKEALADNPSREIRAAELRRRMGVGDEPIGLKIKREIERRLQSEQALGKLPSAA